MVSKKSHKKSAKDKEKSKAKATGQPASVVTPHGKNEGTNTDWAYQPPHGAKLPVLDVDEDFDWDSLKDNEDLELWIMRVPEGVNLLCIQARRLY